MNSLLRSLYTHHKYKIAVFILLSAASLICFALEEVRYYYTGTRRYSMLDWNLYLAWIPMLLASFAYMLSWRRRLVFISIPVFTFLWLIFFPNAPYILTDLEHLNQSSPASLVWYDVIMLVWFSWTGMLLGIVSLSLMQEIIKRDFGRLAGWLAVRFFCGGPIQCGCIFGAFYQVEQLGYFESSRRYS